MYTTAGMSSHDIPITECHVNPSKTIKKTKKNI